MHPGRKWATPSAEGQKPHDQIVREISDHFKAYPPYADIHEIFDRFIADMRQLQPKP